MKYHALLVIFEKAAKFEIVVCCKFKVALYGLSDLKVFITFLRLGYISSLEVENPNLNVV